MLNRAGSSNLGRSRLVNSGALIFEPRQWHIFHILLFFFVSLEQHYCLNLLSHQLSDSNKIHFMAKEIFLTTDCRIWNGNPNPSRNNGDD